MILSSLALLLQLQVGDSTISGRGAPTITAPRLEAEVVVDGALDEAVWDQAVRLGGFSQYQPVDGRPAEEATEILVWYSPTAMHFGIVAHDRRPDAVRATVADRDNIDDDDNVTIYLDTFNDSRRAFFFGVNPLGVQQDGVRSEGTGAAGSIFGGNIDLSPDFTWDSKGRRTVTGYVVEIRIPFKSLRYPGSGPQEWGINFVRQTQRTGYEDTWTDVRRANASFLGQAGTLGGIHDLRRGIVVEAQPFLTATANGLRDGATGAFERDDIDPSAGVNLRLGLTNLSLDATVNPDFSQVEADAGLVTVNERFDLQLSERRPFFLEGIELFATPNQLVYTRQIADPLVGGKITGKFGKLGVAFLTALDEPASFDATDGAPPESEANAFFNVARVRRDLGANSIVGLTYTDRVQGDRYNRVLATDARIVFGRLYFVGAQLGQSWTRDELGTRDAPIWEAEFDRTGRAWGFNYKLTGIGEEFETRSGFVPRSGVVTARAFNRFSFYGARGAPVENLTIFFGPTRTWSSSDFLGEAAIEGEESASFDFQLRGGWGIEANVARAFVQLTPADYAGYQVQTDGGVTPFTPRDEISGAFEGSLSVGSPTFQGFDADAEISFGEVAIFAEAAEGREVRLEGDLTLRPSGSIRIGAEGVYSRITRAGAGGEFARTIIPRLRLEYQPTRALFFRFIGEHFTQRRAALVDPASGDPIVIGGTVAGSQETHRFRMDWLASYEPTPGTVVFLGYGSNLLGPEAFTFSDLRRASDGFFLKLAYQFRR